MVSSIPMNMGYNNNPYIVMPLNKTSIRIIFVGMNFKFY